VCGRFFCKTFFQLDLFKHERLRAGPTGFVLPPISENSIQQMERGDLWWLPVIQR